jgi:hypothetical protein
MTTPPLKYVDCDVPEGMTLAEYRRSRSEAARPAWRTRLRRRLRTRTRRHAEPPGR